MALPRETEWESDKRLKVSFSSLPPLYAMHSFQSEKNSNNVVDAHLYVTIDWRFSEAKLEWKYALQPDLRSIHFRGLVFFFAKAYNVRSFAEILCTNYMQLTSNSLQHRPTLFTLQKLVTSIYGHVHILELYWELNPSDLG